MKKILLGSTALVAASMMAAPAVYAEEPIQLGVSGFMEQYFGYGSSDGFEGLDSDGDSVSNTDPDHFDQKSDSEIIFSGSTTLDNGIQFGVNVQLEGNTSDDQIDESYLFVEGDFGRVLMGSENSAGYIMSVAAPNVGIGINSGDQGDWVPFDSEAGQFRGVLGSTSLENDRVNDANRLTYFTPRFSGLQGGISYTPDAGEDDNTQPSENASYHDGIDLGVNFTESFGGFDIAASGRYGIASNDATGGDDPSIFGAGLNIGFAGFTVGGSYAQQEEAGADEGQSFDIGASYGTGPWGVSVTYFNGEADGGGGSGDEELQSAEVAASYALGPGIKMIGSIGWSEFDDDTDADGDGSNDGYWVVTGLKLNF
ncbi:porin [Denitrobaculum tricleocarpae]|uniref:Porin n=1 Tax=Denitrobaculum tricleocarpae TaxID=2591009 RepID=A0A545TRH1_9PROT|nr:porin [Denitrobaculum tricleocarpae]TQV79818.1 porin [Denitrobaculum tricleocarpae]